MKRYDRLVLSALLTVSCHAPTPSEMQGTVSDGESYRWSTRTIPVCWENPQDDTAAMQKAVERIVGAEYGRVGFVFSGWQSCEAGSPGIHIRVADTDDRHVLAFGARLDGMQDGMQLNLQFRDTFFYGCNGTGTVQCVEEDALHEFGHALGLRHEQSRIDSFCGSDDSAGLGEAGAWRLTAYDKDSIMNYCANDLHVLLAGNSPRLSELDVETLRMYYATNHSLGKETCENDGWQWLEADLASCCDGVPAEELQPFGSKPYHYCNRAYQMSLVNLSEVDLQSFLGSSYETMKHASDAEEMGPWLNVELACHYKNFRAFAWDFYLWGDQLRAFIETRSFPVWMKPASDLVCDGMSIESSDVKSEYLKSSFTFAPTFDGDNPIGGEFQVATSAAYENFPMKYLDVELPRLPFQARSILLSCDQSAFFGYPYATPGLMWIAVRYNANDSDHKLLHCTSLRAFDAEIPRDATQSFEFPHFTYDVRLNPSWEKIKLEL